MKKIKVTIGITIFNEGKNIRNLLKSILSQKPGNYTINKIIVISDGSTDNSVTEAKSVKNAKVKVLNHKKRMGLAYRLNQMFRLSDGDFLVKIDGDVLPKNNELLANLFKNIKSDVLLIGGNREPVPSNRLITRIHNFGDSVWYLTRKDLDKGVSIHNHNGTISAVHKKLYKSIRIPTGYYGLDDLVYLQNLKVGGKFHFAKNAIILYKNPDTFSDYFKQQRRFTGSREKLIEYFGDWINNVYTIPLRSKVRASIASFLNDPIMFIMFIIVHEIIQIKIKLTGYTPPRYGWDITKSTKNISDLKKV